MAYGQGLTKYTKQNFMLSLMVGYSGEIFQREEVTFNYQDVK